MTVDNLVEGWTGDLNYTLYTDGAAFNGTGMTVAAQIYDRSFSLMNPTGKTAWVVAASGTVAFTPADGDIKAERSPYWVRFKVTDGAGKIVLFPTEDAIKWMVRK